MVSFNWWSERLTNQSVRRCHGVTSVTKEKPNIKTTLNKIKPTTKRNKPACYIIVVKWE